MAVPLHNASSPIVSSGYSLILIDCVEDKSDHLLIVPSQAGKILPNIKFMKNPVVKLIDVGLKIDIIVGKSLHKSPIEAPSVSGLK